MIVFLTVCYIAVLAILIKLKVVPLNTFTKISPVIFNVLLFVGLFIPMQFGAPSGPVIAGRHVVQIVPLSEGVQSFVLHTDEHGEACRSWAPPLTGFR